MERSGARTAGSGEPVRSAPGRRLVSVKVDRDVVDKLTYRFPETAGLSYSSRVNIFLRKLTMLADELCLARGAERLRLNHLALDRPSEAGIEARGGGGPR